MSTLKVKAIQGTDGVERFMARAWVNFNGLNTVAIRASGNVSSITDNGMGDYTVNFTAAFADANYCASVTTMTQGSAVTNTVVPGFYSSDSANTTGYAAGSLRIGMKVSAGAAYSDRDFISVVIFR